MLEAKSLNPVVRGCCAGELTPEEAAAKENSIRSLGNRLWAFFGGRAGAEDSADAVEGSTSGDAVEETIPYEDPAVVQRDDHRAFPSETQLLLESIKRQSVLQVLSPQQQKYVASLMRRDVVPVSTSVAEEGADPTLMWCSSGEFEVTQAVSQLTKIRSQHASSNTTVRVLLHEGISLFLVEITTQAESVRAMAVRGQHAGQKYQLVFLCRHDVLDYLWGLFNDAGILWNLRVANSVSW